MSAKIVFATRRFPPSVGGMEVYSAAIAQALDSEKIALIALRKQSRRHLLWFAPICAAKVFFESYKGRRTFIFGDALLFALCLPLVRRDRNTINVLVHGLDVVYGVRLYHRYLRFAFRRADRIVVNSSATQALVSRLVGRDSYVLTPPVSLPSQTPAKNEARSQLVSDYHLSEDSFLIAAVGRLVHRKGFLWFVTDVLPLLPKRVAFLLAGGGPELDELREAIQATAIDGRVVLLGRIDDEQKIRILTGADLVVMPNIPVAGDWEGFGIVAAEAASLGTPVLGSRLEGLTNSIINEQTGVLLPPGDAEAYASSIINLMEDPATLDEMGARAIRAARASFSFESFKIKVREAFRFSPIGD